MDFKNQPTIDSPRRSAVNPILFLGLNWKNQIGFDVQESVIGLANTYNSFAKVVLILSSPLVADPTIFRRGEPEKKPEMETAREVDLENRRRENYFHSDSHKTYLAS